MSLKNNALLLLVCGTLSACGHYSEDLAMLDAPLLQDIAPAAGEGYSQGYADYSTYLAQEYAALARAENEKYDYKSAAYFTKKAKAARKGKDVMPSNFKDFEISDKYAAQVMEAQQNLMMSLQTKKSPENYATLAKAQVQYDSMLEQLSEYHQEEAIIECKDSFYSALNQLQAPQMDELNYAVDFNVGQAMLTEQSVQVLQEALKAYQENPNYEFTIIGYNAPQEYGADYEGQSLAARRAGNVKAALVQAGVPSYMMRVYTSNEQALMHPVSAPASNMGVNKQPHVNVILRLQDDQAAM